MLICALRRLGVAHTRLAEATCGTIRLKLLKIGAQVRVSVRRIKIAMASACPMPTNLHWHTPEYVPRPDAAGLKPFRNQNRRHRRTTDPPLTVAPIPFVLEARAPNRRPGGPSCATGATGGERSGLEQRAFK